MPVLDLTPTQRRRAIRPAARRTRPADTQRWEAERDAPAAPKVEALADWGTLGGAQVGRSHSRVSRALMGISTLNFVLLVVAVSLVFTSYVGHVYATQDLLTELHEARRDNLRLHLRHNRLKAAFDASTSPQAVVPRAYELGLVEGLGGPTLTLDAD
jgi:hypothetical protein